MLMSLMMMESWRLVVRQKQFEYGKRAHAQNRIIAFQMGHDMILG